MNKGIKSMKVNDIWELIPSSEGAKPIGYKWIFKIEKDSNDDVERYKTSLVVNGSTQKEGIDFKDIFSPVSMKDYFRIVMTLVTDFDLKLYLMVYN